LPVRGQYRPNRALDPESAFGDKLNFGYLRFSGRIIFMV
jgi:hypothetical protein